MYASRVTTAHAILVGIDLLWEELACTALECSRLDRLGSLQPPGWDTPAFAQNLRSALHFSGQPSSFVPLLEAAVAKWLAKPRVSLQSLIMEAQLSDATSSDQYLRAWDKILQKRLPILGCTESISDFNLRVLLHPRLVALDPSPAMILVKTLANSWVTSYRFHSEVRFSCLFGCASVHPRTGCGVGDNLRHYLSCPILWRIVEAATGLWAGGCAEHRTGISDCAIDLRLVAIACITYNHLRHHGLGHYHGHISYGDLAETHDSALLAARAARGFIFGSPD